VAKHRLIVWMNPPTLPDHKLFAVANDDDLTFGVAHHFFCRSMSRIRC
jgi:hypothetical protein